jgi:hypothetical protein
MTTRMLSRISGAIALASTSIALLILSLNYGASKVSSTPAVQATIFTPTYSYYLPIVPYEPTCANPPSGTIAISGLATIHGNPAGPGIPFRLIYQTWEGFGNFVFTMTTRSDGSFCSGPVRMLSYCYGIWYSVYQPDSGWWRQIFACESGKIYTVTAEIGQ